MTLRVLLGLICLSIFPKGLLAQVKITYPTNRIVYQRDAGNQARITVAGTYASPVDRVEARFVPVNGGTDTGWSLIQSDPRGGMFAGLMTLKAGWYQLHVRGLFNGKIVSQDSLARVGVGEVFLIMGHSNAAGDDLYTKGAEEERVISVNSKLQSGKYGADEGPANPVYLQDLEFSQLCRDCGIAPFQGVPWVWSQLGDLLVKKLNVPVLFYGAGYGGTSLRQNYMVIKGIPFYQTNVVYTKGMPYINVTNSLQRWVPTTGLRAVLAVHGENDREGGISNVLSRSDSLVLYYHTLIGQSRIDAGQPNLAWVVAISSFKNGQPSPHVTAAQQTVLAMETDVFRGPNLDQVTDRYDGTHYSDRSAQEQVAALWNEALNDSLFRFSTPVLPVPPPIASVACNGSNNQVLSLAGNYTSFTWSNGQQGASITPSPGTYQATVRNEKGFFWFAPPVRVPEQVGPPRPVVEASGPTSFCPGGRVTLTTAGSPTAVRYQWNSGPTETHISVSTAGSYRVRAFDAVNCYSEAGLDVRVFPEPLKPVVVAQGETFFCDTLSVTLAATSQGADSTYRWNSGASSRNLSVNTSGEYRVRGLNRFGCFSPESDPLRVTVIPTPDVPVVERVGPFTLQATTQRRVSQYDWRLDGSPAVTQGNLFKTPRSGNYVVRAFLDSAQVVGGVPKRCYSRYATNYSVVLDAESDGFVVYPVPSADGWVTLDTREVHNNLMVSVFTASGEVLYEKTYPTFEGRLRLYLGPVAGKFFIHVRGQNVRKTKTALVR